MLQSMRKLSQFKMKFVVSLSAFISIFYALASVEGKYEAFPTQFNLTGLNGKNGFAINGTSLTYGSGGFVSKAGDVNADGISDILICAVNGNNNNIFTVYVVFGSKEPWPASIRLDELNGKNGFVLNGAQNAGKLSAIGIGDVNADGIDDVLIGVAFANNYIGQSYVVFGNKGPWPQAMNLSDLDGQNGFVVNGINPKDQSGFSISGAGDVNSDGVADFLIAANAANNYAGQSYVVFGKKQAWPISINLADLDGTNGFTMNGIHSNDGSGVSVSRVGDVNVDGIDDILIGANLVNNYRGQSYIVFGHKSLWPSTIDLGALNGTNGFAINGINPNDNSGLIVSEAGDVNGDGIADFLIGSVSAVNFNYHGQVYLVYGSGIHWPAVFRLADLNGTNGFIISGLAWGPGSSAVRGAGDVNHDGLADIVIGAIPTSIGQSYIVFGSKGPRAVEINVANLNGKNGFTINGINSGDYMGSSVSGVGDFNGDGIDDFLIGADGANNNIGQSYVIFGEREDEEEY